MTSILFDIKATQVHLIHPCFFPNKQCLSPSFQVIENWVNNLYTTLCAVIRHCVDVFFLFIFSPLLPITLLHSSSFCSTFSLLVLLNTMSSANSMHHGGHLLCFGPSRPLSARIGRGLAVVPLSLESCPSFPHLMSPAFWHLRVCPGLAWHIYLILVFLSPSCIHPHFMTWHSVIGLFEVYEYHVQLFIPLPMFLVLSYTANIASVVPLPGRKPNCSSPIIVSSLSLLSIILSQILIVCDNSLIPL